MKRMIAIVLVILTMAAVLAGCSRTETDTGANTGTTNSTTGAASNESGMNGSNGTSSGTNANGSYGSDGMTTPDMGNGTPSSNENGIIDESPSASRDDSVIEEFGSDMRDMVDDAGNAVEDAVEGRRSQNGTGMTGGR